ncbi:MAG: hypothetical protein WCH99_05535 [Verrucomicrobiota bacterium]
MSLQTNHPASSSLRPFWLLVLGFFLILPPLRAQEALRISLADDLAAAMQRQAGNTAGYYNLLLGPVSLRCSAALSADYTDNARNSSQGEGDAIIRPSANVQLTWPVTEWNTLNFSLAAGYLFYAQHSDRSGFYINPSSGSENGLSFVMIIDDWKFNFHDRVSLTQNSSDNPTTPTASAGQNGAFLQNDVGVTGLWNLSKILVNLGCDHVDYLSVGGQQIQNQTDSSSENFSLNVGYKLRPEILVGLEGGLSLVRRDSSGSTNAALASDAIQSNFGAFSSLQISEHLSARLDAGYTVLTPENSKIAGTSATDSLYFNFSVSHEITQHFSYSLSAGNSVDFGYNGQAYERLFVRLNPNWNILRNFTFSTPVWWEQGTQAAVAHAMKYDQFGAGITVGRALTKKLSASVNYQWVMRTTDQTSTYNNYTANTVGLSLSYQF